VRLRRKVTFACTPQLASIVTGLEDATVYNAARRRDLMHHRVRVGGCRVVEYPAKKLRALATTLTPLRAQESMPVLGCETTLDNRQRTLFLVLEVRAYELHEPVNRRNEVTLIIEGARDGVDRRCDGGVLVFHLIDHLEFISIANVLAKRRPQILVFGSMVELEFFAEHVPTAA
jgi:hypothetical protein